MTDTPPPSIARWYDPFVGLAAALAAYGALRSQPLTDWEMAALWVALVCVPMWGLELYRGRADMPIRTAVPARELVHRVAVKWLGIVAGIGALYVFWWLFPMYRGAYYQPLFALAEWVLPAIALLAIPYLFYTEWRLGAAQDFTWYSGRLVLGGWREMPWPVLRDGLLGLFVRAFFLPLNFCYLAHFLQYVRGDEMLALHAATLGQQHAMWMSMIYMLLIVAIVPGYVFSARLIRTQIRAVDRSWFAWAVTLVCYPPLVGAVFGQWFNYKPYVFEAPYMKPWIFLLQDILPAFYLVGAGILLMEIIHWWGEAILGVRASNLTHRGIVTNGPFRYFRHPIYLSKCIGWLLIFLPFAMGPDGWECLRLTLMWGGICLIYWLRSHAEERLLAADPLYVAYARWVDRHGALAWLGRCFPWLTFEWRVARRRDYGAIID
jgi:isoprenylcysteine carboxyl methyltransferase (ICMT) family protein YpbQ